VKLVHLVDFIAKKFVMMHGHTNGKKKSGNVCLNVNTEKRSHDCCCRGKEIVFHILTVCL